MSQVQQLREFCRSAGLDMSTVHGLVAWIFVAIEVWQVRRSTAQAKLNAWKFWKAFQDGQPCQERQGSDLYLLRRYITRMADDRWPKRAIQLGMLTRVVEHMYAIRQRPKARQLAAWYMVSHAALFRASEAMSLRWEHVQWQRPAQRPPQGAVVTLTATGTHDFKTHQELVRFRFDHEPGVVGAFACWMRWWRECGSPQSGPVFTLPEAAARQEQRAQPWGVRLRILDCIRYGQAGRLTWKHGALPFRPLCTLAGGHPQLYCCTCGG
jgi:hypothetical protein